MNRLMQESAKALLIVFLVVGFVTAPDAAAGAASDEQTLRFCYWASFRDNEFFRVVCERFERDHPGINIQREWVPGDYGTKLQLLLISDTAADIILMDDEIAPAYTVRGYLEDLTPYIERDREALRLDDFLPTSMESFAYKGIQGALPWDGNSVLMFYNKDLFDAEGIPYPDKDWTWYEFRDIARRLTKDLDGDNRIDQFGTNFVFGFMGFEPLLWCFGGEVLNEDYTRSRIHEAPGIEAAQFIYDMQWKDHSIAWTGEMERIFTEVQLLTGRVGMVMAGSYMMIMLDSVTDAMDWGVAHMPIGPRGHRYTRVTWDGISINAHIPQERKELAWEFIKSLVSDENQASIGIERRGVPVRRTDAWKYYVNPESYAQEEVALEAMDYGKLTPITPRYLELRAVIEREFDLLNAGTKEPPEIFARLEHHVNEVLEKEMQDWAERLGVATEDDLGRYSGVKGLVAAVLLLVLGALGLFLIPQVRARARLKLEDTRLTMRSRMARSEAIQAYLFASPWILGFLLFTAFPIVFSIVLSFCEWDPYETLDKMKFVGLANYTRALSGDPLVGDRLMRKALYNTFFYAGFAVPLSLCTSLGLALLLNQKFRGITIFRTTFYIPSIVGGVATSILWLYIFNPVFGPLNGFIRILNKLLDASVALAFINLPEPMWLADPHWAKPALIIMAIWGAGGAGMLIFLAGLQGVPAQLYEVAELDGAGRWRKFWNITLPMLTPTIYFNLIMGLIGTLQEFMRAFVMVGDKGGVDNSLLFYVLHLYRKAFIEFEMGYASALAWILFVIILSLTLLVIRSSATWVYYEGGERK